MDAIITILSLFIGYGIIFIIFIKLDKHLDIVGRRILLLGPLITYAFMLAFYSDASGWDFISSIFIGILLSWYMIPMSLGDAVLILLGFDFYSGSNIFIDGPAAHFKNW